MQWLRELLSLHNVLLTILRFSTLATSFDIFPASFPEIKVAFFAFPPITSNLTWIPEQRGEKGGINVNKPWLTLQLKQYITSPKEEMTKNTVQNSSEKLKIAPIFVWGHGSNQVAYFGVLKTLTRFYGNLELDKLIMWNHATSDPLLLYTFKLLDFQGSMDNPWLLYDIQGM